jgi:hypothetical protein
MSTQKLQVGRALEVIPSDNCDVPFPAVNASGINDSFSPFKLVDTTQTFITKNIRVGDIVYNNTNFLGSVVTNIDSETTLSLANNIFTGPTKSYTIYAGGNNDGCVLFVGTAGNIEIVTVGGDTVSLVGVSGGQFIPVHVRKVLYSGTSATNIIALW